MSAMISRSMTALISRSVRVKQAAEDGALTYIASTYDPVDQIIRDGIYEAWT